MLRCTQTIPATQEHVLDRIKHFAVVFAQELVPSITQQQLDVAFSRTLYMLSAQETQSAQAQLRLQFTHSCRRVQAAVLPGRGVLGVLAAPW